MGIKIKNLQTGEFEKFNIPALKGEKGEPGEIEPSEKVDYIGKQHSKLRDTMNANVDYIIKTAIGEFNYLDYEGQHITATNSIEGHAKSAILSGQTKLMDELGNECDHPNRPKAVRGAYIDASTGEEVFADASCRTTYIKPPHETFKIRGKNRWKKLAFYDVNKQLIKTLDPALNSYDDYIVNGTLIPSNAEYMRVSGSLNPINSGDVTEPVLEILDVNNSSLYITQLQSCKMPVLTTTGKNLVSNMLPLDSFGGSVTTTTVVDSSSTIASLIEVGGNITLTVSKENKGSRFRYFMYRENPVKGKTMSIGGQYVDNRNTVTFATQPDTKYLLVVWCLDKNIDYPINPQIEYGNQVTPYEPYKSNILTVNEPVELRGIGDVKDTLDCLTGDLTQHIGEIVLDGSRTYILNNDYNGETTEYIGFYTNLSLDLDYKPLSSNKNVYCDSLSVIPFSDLKTVNGEWITLRYPSSGRIYVKILRSKLTEQTVGGFREYLSNNPITVQYELATYTIKTVDLSDDVVYSYKDTTHYTCSSEEGSLVPTLSVKVPTDTQLTIQEQKATTQTLLIKNIDLQQSIKEVQAMNLAFNTALYNSFNSIREEVEDIKKHVSTNENLEGSF